MSIKTSLSGSKLLIITGSVVILCVLSVDSIMYDNKYDDSDYAYMSQYYNIFFTIFKKCFDENLTHVQNIHENHSTVIDTIFTNSG